MNRLIIIFISIFIVSFESNAQQTKDALSRLESGEDLKVIYRNEASGGVFVHTAGGIGLNFSMGRQINVDRKRMFEIETSNFKHAKEVKSVNDQIANFQGYFYGKLNSVLLFRSGVGFQNALFQKAQKKNVQIRYSTFLGGTIAFAKPIYLEIRYPEDSVASERYNPEIHNRNNILGKSPFFKGIGGAKVVPGAYAKLALSVEYGERYNSIQAIETGVIADFYPSALQIMANQKQLFYFSMYIKMVWGKKWF